MRLRAVARIARAARGERRRGGSRGHARPRSGAKVVVEIARLASGGDGVGRLPDGRTVFVPASAPGDRALIRLTEEKKRFARGEIVELIDAGPARIEPLCPAVGVCGGCAWQHLDYATQVEAKQQILRDAVERIAGRRLDSPPSMTPSPARFGYRMRARLLEVDSQLGYRALRSHAICPVGHCPVLTPELNAELAALGDRVAATREPGPGSQSEAREAEWEIAVGSDGFARSSRLDDAGATEVGDETITLSVRGHALRVSPGTFFQANGLLHARLLDGVASAVGTGGGLLELHAGAGFFTLALAAGFERVQVVESGGAAVRDLRVNLDRAGLTHVEVIEGRAEAVLEARVHAQPDVLLADPPRAGLGAATVRAICAIAPARVVYLSCDPATLSRDIAEFDAAGYTLRSIAGFDLFPQTPHIEALALLDRNAPPR